MKNEQESLDLQNRLESVDTVQVEPMPAGWSRRNWVQREAIAFAALAVDLTKPPRNPLPE
jgi:hypothetical protein